MQKIIHPSLVIAPNPALRKLCTKWCLPAELPALKDCIQLMKEVLLTMGEFGLSAPQVNIHKQVFILRDLKFLTTESTPKFYCFVNPRLTKTSDKKCLFWETCVSLREYSLSNK